MPVGGEDRSSSEDRRFLAWGSWVNGLGLVTRIASPLLVILLARAFPQKEFGAFIAVQSFTMTLARIAILGLDKGLLWHIAGQEGGAGRSASGSADAGRTGLAESLLLSSGLGLLIAFISTVTVAGLGWRPQGLSEGSLPFLALMFASVLPQAGVQILSAALEGRRKPQYRVLIATFFTFSSVPALALLFQNHLPGELSLGLGMFLGWTLGLFAFIPVLRRHFPAERWWNPRRPPEALLRYSLPLALSEVVGGVVQRVDLWMVLLLLGPEKAAVYAVMITITNGIRTVRQAFEPLLVPIVSKMGGEDASRRLKPLFSSATHTVSLIQMAVAAFILFFPREVLSLAGRDYVLEVMSFSILVLGNLFGGFLALNGAVVLGLGQSRLVFGVNMAALGLNLLGNALLIPRFGMAGAALASMGAYCFQGLAYHAYVRWRRGLRLYEGWIAVNAVLEASLILAYFGFHERIEGMDLRPRITGFVLTALLPALLFFIHKNSSAKTDSQKRPFPREEPG